MRMKTAPAFPAYAKIRARQTIERIAATARFIVKSVNKDGSISRAKPTRDTWLREAFVTAEEAEKRRADIEAMNPGSRFTVVALGSAPQRRRCRGVKSRMAAVLVRHGLRPRHACTDQRRLARKSRIEQRRGSKERRWLGRHLLRFHGSGGQRVKLGSDEGRGTVRVALPSLRSDQGADRRVLEADGHGESAVMSHARIPQASF